MQASLRLGWAAARQLRWRWSSVRTLAAAATLTLTTLSCRGDATRRSAPPPLRVAVRADVTGFFPNPPIEPEGFTFAVNWLVYEGLVAVGEGVEVRPALASRWTSPDERTYVFEIRPGARFSDGHPITAEDVVASLLFADDRGWVNRDALQGIESVTALGPGSVRIRTRFPDPFLLTRLPWGLILPRDSLRETPVPPVGSGPYRLRDWEPGRGFVLTRNTHFAPPPAFERVEFEVVPDDADRLRLLIEGETDLVDNVPLERLDELQRRGLHVAAGQTPRVIFLGMRDDTVPFTDVRVRRAIALALDRAELIATAYGGRTAPATQLVPPAVVGFNPDLPVPEPDRDRARSLLAAAGYPEGFDVRLDGPHNRYVYDAEMMAEVARQLATVGIRVEVNALDKTDFFALAYAGRSPFHLLGWECSSGQAGEALDALMHSRADGYGDFNTTGVADARLDRLIELASGETDTRKRGRLMQEAMARIEELHLVVPLVVQSDAIAYSPTLDWEPDVEFISRITRMRPAR